MRGLLVVVSSPSGGGKTTVICYLLQRDHAPYVYSVSATTRSPRKGERDGIDYYFVTAEKFEQMRKDEQLAEWAEVHGYYYGTPSAPLERHLREGETVLMDLDIAGARSIRGKYPNDSLLIFIKPPSMEDLMKRLKRRHTENEHEINRRLQRMAVEMEAASWFDYVVVNQELAETVNKVEALIAERRKKILAKP